MAARYVHIQGFTRGYSPPKTKYERKWKQSYIFLSGFSRENNL